MITDRAGLLGWTQTATPWAASPLEATGAVSTVAVASPVGMTARAGRTKPTSAAARATMVAVVAIRRRADTGSTRPPGTEDMLVSQGGSEQREIRWRPGRSFP